MWCLCTFLYDYTTSSSFLCLLNHCSCEAFFHLLNVLGVDLTMHLLVQVLTEQKILLTSVHNALLMQIGEALTRVSLFRCLSVSSGAIHIKFITQGLMKGDTSHVFFYKIAIERCFNHVMCVCVLTDNLFLPLWRRIQIMSY